MTTPTAPNRPLITAIVMLVGALTGVPILIAAVMAYLFRGDVSPDSWEATHYSYHIRTFWISILLVVVGVVLLLLVIGAFIIWLVPIWVIIRALIPLIKAANRVPMPNPRSWLF